MNKKEAEEMLEYSEKATPGPWQVSGPFQSGSDRTVYAGTPNPGQNGVALCMYAKDANLIAHARTVLPELARAYMAVMETLESTQDQLAEANTIIESLGAEADHFCKVADSLRARIAQLEADIARRDEICLDLMRECDAARAPKEQK